AGALARGRRLPRAVLHVPRGRRHLGAAACRRARGRDRARRGRRPRLRVRRQRAEVVLARAQPPRLPRPHLSRPVAGAARAGAAGDRARAPARLRHGRLGEGEAAGEPRLPPLAAPPPARAPGDPAAAHDQPPRVRGDADAGPRLRPDQPARPLAAGPLHAPWLLAPRPPLASVADFDRTWVWRKSDAL